jgi:hypothetical protein
MCRYVSLIFLVIQIMSLIDSSYAWNSAWVQKEWFKQILAVCFALFLVSYIFTGYFFSWFASGESCGTQRFFIAFSLVTTIAATLLSLSKMSPHGALLPSAVVTAYCSFLLYSALTSDPSACNSLTSQGSKTLQLVIGILIASFSIVKSSWDMSTTNLFGARAAESSSLSSAHGVGADVADPSPLSPSSQDDHAAVSIGMNDASSDRRTVAKRPHLAKGAVADDDEHPHRKASVGHADDGGDDDDADTEELRKSNLLFHASNVIAACYLSMLLTNWGSVSDNSTGAIDVGWPAVWIKMASQWVTLALYTWTLLAPSLMPDRDFS